jgi:hypothetical protein
VVSNFDLIHYVFWRWIRVDRKGKQFLLHNCVGNIVTSQERCKDMIWLQNISMVICDTQIFPNCKPSHDGDHESDTITISFSFYIPMTVLIKDKGRQLWSRNCLETATPPVHVTS